MRVRQGRLTHTLKLVAIFVVLVLFTKKIISNGDLCANKTYVSSPTSPVPFLRSERSRKLIFDVGFNTGQDSHTYLTGDHDVIGVEANPLLVREAKQDARFTTSLAKGRLKLLNVGISDQSWDTLEFYVNKFNNVFSSFDTALGCRSRDWSQSRASSNDSCYSLPILTLKCSDLIAIFGVPYYMKIDIEGKDYGCVQSLQMTDDPQQSPSPLPTYISVEGLPTGDVAALLKVLGYDVFKVVDQSPFDGASGPFGDNANDVFEGRRWLPWDAIVARKYPTVINGTVRHWYDVHASFASLLH